jgi:hypothetical protein
VAGDACCLTMFFPHLGDLAVDEVTDQGDYVLVAPGSAGQPSAVTPGSAERPSPATPRSTRRPSAAPPGSTGRPSAAAPGSTGDLPRWRLVHQRELRASAPVRPPPGLQGLVLDDVQFAQPVQIEVSSTGMCCRRARFPGGVRFRLRWARVVLDDTDFDAPSILAGIPHLSDDELGEREEQIARAWQQKLAGEISERPQVLSLRRANVAGLTLSNVSAADCRFVGAHNLDMLRVESDVSFATAPSPMSLRGRRWAGREVIAEERTWRANRLRRFGRHWAAPMWPSLLDDQRPGVLDPGRIAGLYRALRKGREDIKNEPGAADFYYGEMEMRRARPLSDGNREAQPRVTSRGWVERRIVTAYWFVSGYGLRAWRAVACLLVITAGFAAAFYQVGFAVPPHPASYWTSLLYAFRATLSLTDDQVKLTAWGQLLQGVLRLTGPVLLGLALLALRGRVRR